MTFYAKITTVTSSGEASERCIPKEAHIERFGEILGEAGLNPKRFSEWTIKYGANSRGMSPQGEYLLEGFPTYSMLAWVDVESVILPSEKLSDLINECEDLIVGATSAEVRAYCENIQALARCAHDNGLFLRFDGT
jgi:hypothetical protein